MVLWVLTEQLPTLHFTDEIVHFVLRGVMEDAILAWREKSVGNREVPSYRSSLKAFGLGTCIKEQCWALEHSSITRNPHNTPTPTSASKVFGSFKDDSFKMSTYLITGASRGLGVSLPPHPPNNNIKLCLSAC